MNRYPILQPQDSNLFTKLTDKRTKYQWDEMNVGCMFFVPRVDFTPSQIKDGFKVTAPTRLTKEGFKIAINQCKDVSGREGVLVTRTN